MDSSQSLNRNRAIFIFAVGLIALVLIFLGGLFFSGQRGDQLQRLATADRLKTNPAAKSTEPKKTEPKKDIPKKSDNAQSGTTDKKDDTKKPVVPAKPKPNPTPAPQPKPVVPAQTSNDKPIPATGGSADAWLAVPTMLVVGYVGFEYRRSRQAIQRAAFHENSAF